MPKELSITYLCAVGVLIATAISPPVQAQTELENRLRDALRQATAQLRTAEDDRARPQAENSQLQAENKGLRGQLQQLQGSTGGISQEQAAELERRCQAAVDEVGQRVMQEQERSQRLQESLEKWKAGYNEAVTAFRAKEKESEVLAGQATALNERAALCAQKNKELFTVGNEILDRWQGTGWRDVLAAREPFIGLKRVELENLVQDYQDKLLDNQLPVTSSK